MESFSKAISANLVKIDVGIFPSSLITTNVQKLLVIGASFLTWKKRFDVVVRLHFIWVKMTTVKIKKSIRNYLFRMFEVKGMIQK